MSSSPKDTFMLGKSYGILAQEGDVVFLQGDLGTGKTQFVKGVAEGLGIKRAVTSPTFPLENIYPEGRLELFHYDLYRLKDEHELFDLDIFDIAGTEGVAIIEWGASFADAIHPYRLELTFSRDLTKGDDTRIVTGVALGQRAETCLAQIERKVLE